jgi:hypothetical protein
LALAARKDLFPDFERLSANSSLVRESIAAIAEHANLQLHPSILFDVKIAQLNEAVTGAISSIHFEHLAALDRGLGHRLAGLSDSYRDIFARLPEVESGVTGFVTELPSRDMIVKSTIISSRATHFEPSEAQIDLEEPAYARSDLDPMLMALDPDYVTVLDEVFDAFSRRSLGRKRHVLVSLRELITHVLHHLSPDNELRAWSTDPTHFHNNKPTRAARHLYICRFVNCGPYSEYVKKSSGMTTAFFDALNGLHDVRPDIDEFQLRLMVTDALHILRFLLRTAQHRP